MGTSESVQKASRWPGASQTAQDWHGLECYGCGPKNRYGLQADFRFDEESGEVRFSFLPLPRFVGAPGFLHGGVTAALLDEAQGVLCFHIGHVVMTDQLSVDYKRAIPIADEEEVIEKREERAGRVNERKRCASQSCEISIRAYVTAVRKKRIFTRAEVRDRSDRVVASSKGRWYLLNDRMLRLLFQGDYPPEEEERIRQILEVNRRRARDIRTTLRQPDCP